MRILLITPTLPSATGLSAIPVLLHAELRGLAAGHDVTLVTSVGDEAWEPEAARALIREHPSTILADRRIPRSSRLHRRRQGERLLRYGLSGIPWRTVWFQTENLQAAVDRAIATRGPFDIVALEDSATGALRLPAGLPSVYTEHEVRWRRPVRWDALGAPSQWPRWAFDEHDWRRWTGYQRMVWNRFDLVQAFTERDARSIAEMEPWVAGRVRVNPFGVELPTLGPPVPEQPDSLLFTGHFSHFPNVDAARWLAREIMPRVLERRPTARLQIVGSAPTEEIFALAGPGVEIVGEVDSIDAYQARAAVVLAPIRYGGGMRMKVLNAMAGARPVITTERGSEGFYDAGVDPPLVLAESVGEFADRAVELLDDPDRRRRLAEAGRRFVETVHSPDAWARRLGAVYREAIERHRDRPSR